MARCFLVFRKTIYPALGIHSLNYDGIGLGVAVGFRFNLAGYSKCCKKLFKINDIILDFVNIDYK